MTEEKARRKIEDMTLRQIKDLKAEIADEVRKYLKGLAEITAQNFDVGAIGFDISTDIRLFKTEWGEEFRSPDVTYNVDIHFSKEEI